MAINSVDMDRALNSASYAQQAVRSGKLTADQRGQLVAKWGADKINQWSSVDGTEYVIDDASYDAAKEAGKQATADSVGYNGKKNYRSVADTALSTAGAVGGRVLGATVFKSIGAKILGGKVAGAVAKKAGTTAATKAGEKAIGKCVGDIATVTFAAAEVAHYLAAKPNDDQYDAAMKVMESELPQGEASLYDAQANMEDATAEITELSEEAAELNEETNENIEEQKILFDFYRNQYEAIKTKAESGVPLTLDEKALAEKLAPMMTEIGEGIITLGEETTEGVEELYGNIEGYQESYDEAGETIAEVEGMTDYAEGFDENTRTMCYFEAAAQGINSASAGAASASLFAKASAPGAWALYIPAGIGAVASLASAKFVLDQTKMASDISDEIHARRGVQELGVNTTEIYGEELDNFEGTKEVVEDLELEMPEDLETPQPIPVPTGEDGGDPLAAAAAGTKPEDEGTGSPLTGGQPPTANNAPLNNNDNNNGVNNNPEEDDPNKKKPEEEDK